MCRAAIWFYATTPASMQGSACMFVVQLPVEGGHTGGTLSVRHGDQEQIVVQRSIHSKRSPSSRGAELSAHSSKIIRTRAYSSYTVHQAAFFGDCEHELLPVTSGLRLCLLYNLVRTTTGMPPAAKSVSNSSIAAEISTAVAAWCADPDTRNRPAKLAVKLEHEYTATNLSFAGLKGRDAT
eukprot:15192-Heterococcus_DN1.PRE.2